MQADATAAERPLTGTRVIDLGWITAGAGTSAILADLGADVIKVEGPGSPDPFRMWEGAEPGTDWWNHCPYYSCTNRDKRSVCLDLKSVTGRGAMLRLIATADVVVENFRRGVMAGFGLDAAMLRERFPRLIVASISSQGEDGPDRDMVSYGSTLEAAGGLASLTGVGEAPVITGRDVNYPDQVVCLFASGAIVSALLERRRTGEGAHLDLSQRELTSFLLGEEVIAAAHGVPALRRGNDDPLQPGVQLVRDADIWAVTGGGVSAPVRDGVALVGAPEFKRGTAISYAPDGSPAKGIPFRLAHAPLAIGGRCHDLGADNAAVLTEAGFSLAEIAALMDAGVLATAPPADHGRTMTPALFRTRMTELFGIRHPILAGGLMWLSDARYVAAVVNAGGMGFITSRSFATLDAFRTELALCDHLTGGKPFGVNLSTSRHTAIPLADYVQAALEAGVRCFETSGRAPADDLIAAIRRANAVVIHKVPLVRHAQTAERLGVDAIAIVGMECGGHPGINTDMPAMMGGAIAAGRLRVPFAIGGGIGTGRQLLAALAMGADAVLIGTRFAAAAEVAAHPAYKQRVVDADENSSVIAFAGKAEMGGAWRVLDNATAREVKQREADGHAGHAAFADLLAGSLTAEGCYGRGDCELGMVSLGPAACFIPAVEPMGAIIDSIIDEARFYRDRLDGLFAA